MDTKCTIKDRGIYDTVVGSVVVGKGVILAKDNLAKRKIGIPVASVVFVTNKRSARL